MCHCQAYFNIIISRWYQHSMIYMSPWHISHSIRFSVSIRSLMRTKFANMNSAWFRRILFPRKKTSKSMRICALGDVQSSVFQRSVMISIRNIRSMIYSSILIQLFHITFWFVWLRIESKFLPRLYSLLPSNGFSCNVHLHWIIHKLSVIFHCSNTLFSNSQVFRSHFWLSFVSTEKTTIIFCPHTEPELFK